MSALIRGTTPTITFTFNTVSVSAMAVAYMTLNQGTELSNYDLSNATVDSENNTLSWKLTQEDTLALTQNKTVEIQCRYRLNDNSAGASKIYKVDAYRILKDGEI